MHNPLKSEAEAFRWVVVIAAGAATVVALTLVTRPLFGLIWALVLIAYGVLFLYRSSRGSDRSKLVVTRGGDGRHRVLAMANQTVRTSELIATVIEHAGEADSEVLLIVPALPSSRAKMWASDIDEAAELARQRMELTQLDLRERLKRVKAEVGDSDPIVALTDALAKFPADEIVISTLPPGRSHWLEQNVVERAREELNIPVHHVVPDPTAVESTIR